MGRMIRRIRRTIRRAQRIRRNVIKLNKFRNRMNFALAILSELALFGVSMNRAMYVMVYKDMDLPMYFNIAFIVLVLGISAMFPIKEEIKKKRKYLKFMYRCTMCTLLILLCIGEVFCHMKTKKSERMEITQEELEQVVFEKEEAYMSGNLDLLNGIIPTSYQQSGHEEKMDALSKVVAVECKYLGIQPPEVIVDETPSGIHGQTNREGTRIVIKDRLVDHEKSCLETLFHELYHVYQIQCTKDLESDSELLWARQVREWKAENEGKKEDKTENRPESYAEIQKQAYLNYYSSSMEIAAREYSEKRMERYKQLFGIE